MKRGFCGFAFYKKTKNCGAREENYCSLAGGYSADYKRMRGIYSVQLI